MNIVGIIPARLASSRFPSKPMAQICGIPMVGHVLLRSRLCKSLSNVYVATCDNEISAYVSGIGGKAVMTLSTHQRASDRAAEAMLKIEKETGKKIDVAVMIQGDEPLIYPEMIEQAVGPILTDNTIQVVNLMGTLSTREEHDDPHEIKVVVDLNNFALYFSREPIPSWKKDAMTLPMLKQVCVIPFRRDFLIKFNKLTPTPLEIVESIDMLRVLEHGYRVKMVFSKYASYSVDTPADLIKVEKIMQDDKLFNSYRKDNK